MSLTHHQSFVKVALFESGDFQIQHKGCRISIKTDQKKVQGKRGKINALSSESARRCLTAFRATAHLFKVEITLTYPLEMLERLNGPVSKEHLNRFIKWITYNHGKDTVYAWVLEFQGSGNPHFHVLVDRFIPKAELSQAWYDIVDSGLKKHLNAGTRVSEIRSPIGMADYMARYLNKIKQKDVPPTFLQVGRFWGCKRGIVKPLEFTLAYPDPDSAFRALRPLRKARKASLRRFNKKNGSPIKWRWGGSGFTDRSMGFAWASEVLGNLKGESLLEE